MRPLALMVGLLCASGGGCGDDQPRPIDAPTEHVVPADLGQRCGLAAGCFRAVDQPAQGCAERCVTLGVHDAICTTRCNGDQDCGPAAQFCNFGEGANRGVCTPYQDLENDMGCMLPDAATSDGSAADAP